MFCVDVYRNIIAYLIKNTNWSFRQKMCKCAFLSDFKSSLLLFLLIYVLNKVTLLIFYFVFHLGYLIVKMLTLFWYNNQTHLTLLGKYQYCVLFVWALLFFSAVFCCCMLFFLWILGGELLYFIVIIW